LANIVGMYAVVDIETTGGNTQSDHITEIAILMHDGEKVVDAFCSLVDPERRIPYRITEITGITNEMVNGAPKFYEIARKVVEMTDGCTLVAHNARFDYGFLRNEFKSLGFDYKRPVLCTVELSRNLLPGQKTYRLGDLCRSIGIEVKTVHRALADAQSTARLFEHLQEVARLRTRDLGEGGRLGRMNPDANLKREQIEKLPRETGVYYFYDAWHQLIYVGKSVDIRGRVMSHFANNATARALEMKAHIAHIDCTVTGSELVALLKESEEIKRFKPRFNRAQRRSRFHVGLFAEYDAAGYLTFHTERIRKGGASPASAFSSVAEAKSFLDRMLDEHRLCQRLMGLQKGKGPCFHHGIHKCLGACIGKEHHLEYNERAQRVISRLQYNRSNFLIVDRGRNTEEKSLVLVENGKYTGYGFVENEFMDSNVALLKNCVQPFSDNKDVRQIINLYLRQGKAEKVISFG
jgi:DNA polymerase III subunit epsilon